MSIPHPILYSNKDHSVFLVDIPSSIQHGQCSSSVLRSCSPLQTPYPDTEPKGSKRVAAQNAVPPHEQVYHASIQEQVSSALKEISARVSSHGLSWYRHREPMLTQPGRKHARQATLSLAEPTPSAVVGTDPIVPVILSSTERRNKFPSLDILHRVPVHNPSDGSAVVETIDSGHYLIPPRSTFIYSPLQLGHPTSSVWLHLATSNRFDLILMDPPWTNRSVRHASQYRTAEDQGSDPFRQATEIVETSLSPQGLVAIWITNKASIRANVVQTFGSMGFSLEEEWIWIKVTTQGLPVMPLNGLWRRPYEVLLLFRRREPGTKPQRRIIAAVPDLHSRKPCLKVLLEELLPPQPQVLELFARSLIAGWYSWGDEVLKFQRETHWTSPEES
ncbi:hypothetical protein RBB50_009045 [Rhinocladiella similis]